MTVGELVYALQQQPEDLQVVFPDYLVVTRVVRVKDKSLPKNLEDVVTITDEDGYDDMVYGKVEQTIY